MSFLFGVWLHQRLTLTHYAFLLVVDNMRAEIQKEAPWCILFASDVGNWLGEKNEIHDEIELWRKAF